MNKNANDNDRYSGEGPFLICLLSFDLAMKRASTRETWVYNCDFSESMKEVQEVWSEAWLMKILMHGAEMSHELLYQESRLVHYSLHPWISFNLVKTFEDLLVNSMNTYSRSMALWGWQPTGFSLLI